MNPQRYMPDIFRRPPFRRALRPIIRDFLRKGVLINLPPQGFDPREASDRELEIHFLPPRPNRKKSPLAYVQWVKAMSGPPTWPDLAPDAQRVENLFVESRLLSHPGLAGTSHVPGESSSFNWSGAFARPFDHSHVTRAQGLWTVPEPKPLDLSEKDYASSMWVGLDGHDPASRSMPQVGTGQWVSVDNAGNATPAIFTWWQWFVRDGLTNAQIALPVVPVKVGHVVYAQVSRIAPEIASIFIINLTTNVALPFWFRFVSPIQPPLSPTNPLPPRIEGITAEWILERPAHLDTKVIYPLPDYGKTTFDFCCAGTDSTGPFQEFNMDQARLIRMVDWEITPPSGKVVSTSERDGPLGMRLHFG